MQPEGLDEQEPECHQEHRDHRPPEKFSRARVIKGREDREGENAEISKRAQAGDGKAADFRIRTSQHFEAVGRGAANRGFSRKKNNREISRFNKTDERDQGRRRIKNDLGAGTATC